MITLFRVIAPSWLAFTASDRSCGVFAYPGGWRAWVRSPIVALPGEWSTMERAAGALSTKLGQPVMVIG